MEKTNIATRMSMCKCLYRNVAQQSKKCVPSEKHAISIIFFYILPPYGPYFKLHIPLHRECRNHAGAVRDLRDWGRYYGSEARLPPSFPVISYFLILRPRLHHSCCRGSGAVGMDCGNRAGLLRKGDKNIARRRHGCCHLSLSMSCMRCIMTVCDSGMG